jgi:hypothetical protein
MTPKIEHGIGNTPGSFDYTTDAELFSSKLGRPGRQPLIYRRFVSAAEAIRFAIEDLPAQFLVGTYLEVGDSRLPSAEIRRLYVSSHYPLARKATDAHAWRRDCE